MAEVTEALARNMCAAGRSLASREACTPVELPPAGPSLAPWPAPPAIPPQNGEAPSPGGQGPVLGRRFPDQRAERARQVQRPNPRQVRVDFVPVSFSPPTTTTGGLTFGVPLARQTILLAVV